MESREPLLPSYVSEGLFGRVEVVVSSSFGIFCQSSEEHLCFLEVLTVISVMVYKEWHCFVKSLLYHISFRRQIQVHCSKSQKLNCVWMELNADGLARWFCLLRDPICKTRSRQSYCCTCIEIYSNGLEWSTDDLTTDPRIKYFAAALSHKQKNTSFSKE